MIYVGRLGYLAEIIWLFEHQTGQVYKAVNQLVVKEWHFRLSLLPYPTSKYFSDNSEGHAQEWSSLLNLLVLLVQETQGRFTCYAFRTGIQEKVIAEDGVDDASLPHGHLADISVEQHLAQLEVDEPVRSYPLVGVFKHKHLTAVILCREFELAVSPLWNFTQLGEVIVNTAQTQLFGELINDNTN